MYIYVLTRFVLRNGEQRTVQEASKRPIETMAQDSIEVEYPSKEAHRKEKPAW